MSIYIDTIDRSKVHAERVANIEGSIDRSTLVELVHVVLDTEVGDGYTEEQQEALDRVAQTTNEIAFNTSTHNGGLGCVAVQADVFPTYAFGTALDHQICSLLGFDHTYVVEKGKLKVRD